MGDQSQDHPIIALGSLTVPAFVLVPNYSGTSVHTLLPGSPAPAWKTRGSSTPCLIKAAALPQALRIPTHILNLPFSPCSHCGSSPTSLPTLSFALIQSIPPAVLGLHMPETAPCRRYPTASPSPACSPADRADTDPAASPASPVRSPPPRSPSHPAAPAEGVR